MRGRAPTPLGAVARGAVAGVIGTGLMTAWQELSAKLKSSDAPAPDATPADPWDQAPAPAKVARRVSQGIFQHDVAPDLIPLLTNVMHWGYGTGWGTLYGIVTAGRGGAALRRGVVFGTAVWASSYLQLVPMGLYDPPWDYPPEELALDLSYHLAYGIGAAVAFKIVDR